MSFHLQFLLPVEIEVHTVPHFKGTISGKVEPEGLECDGIFIFYQVRPKLDRLLHKMGFVDSDMHTTVHIKILSLKTLSCLLPHAIVLYTP